MRFAARSPARLPFIPVTTMARAPEDPLVRSARREAAVVLLIWAVALIYSVGYCWLFGYHRAPSELTFVWGIPDWVMWGVFAPWLACYLVSLWFSYGFMTDDELGEERPPPSEVSTAAEAPDA